MADEEGQPQHINLKVKSQDGKEVFFKVKKWTKFEKLMNAYHQKLALAPNSVRFLFDGDRIAKESTPDDLGMEDGDVIDAVAEQQGGGSG
ncbi:unnamed protein product [Vitrella brassicaformis CCMP3155]|uniref:Ubiquitin-like domain-containing protein n=1 Tax=Vitrella brassicaformis (strain CCMP3155) TaxID=1169540 RepID=A0A0G4ELU2_VITBC|nr:unnamed protein product [Vitrella brassicaformis CCMP3155]|mmetsp:Transcript_21054/g.51314  ORF Transcript_21054/g.51314 Transcript_21054/m.51314 type:complete len:90 (+) Transcript_21054:62-331(+)|eukprot:CEL97803.1 unnamed protein product [Vitrella brassicaformis CCMP3155]